MNVQKRPLSEEETAQIQSLPKLSALLPKQIGSNILTTVRISCPVCSNEIAAEDIVGMFNDTSVGASALSGYSFCANCKIIIPLAARFHPDGKMLFKYDGGWQESFYIFPKKVKILAKILSNLLPAGIAIAVTLLGYTLFFN